MSLKIKLTSIMVDDQARALRFYTEVLGFAKCKDIDVGGGFRWITLIAPEGHADVELALEPNSNPASLAFQRAMFEQSIPATAFEVDNVLLEYQRLKGLGVVFTVEPLKMGPISVTVFEDTCGNLIQLYQLPEIIGDPFGAAPR